MNREKIIFATVLSLFLIAVGVFGYIQTNYITADYVNSTGMIYYKAQNEIALSPGVFQLPGVNPPNEVIIGTYPLLAFSASTQESAYTSIHVPAQYKENSDWQIEFYWTANSASSAQFVSWCVEFVKTRSEDSGYINATSTTACVNDTFSGMAYRLQDADYINISGNNTLKDDQFGFRIYRDVAVDDLAVDALLTEVTVYYEEDKIGYAI